MSEISENTSQFISNAADKLIEEVKLLEKSEEIALWVICIKKTEEGDRDAMCSSRNSSVCDLEFLINSLKGEL